MVNDLHFSFAEKKDVADLDQLVNSAYRGESSKFGWTTEAAYLDGIRTDQEQLQKMIETDDAIILICRQEEKIIGCVYLHKQGLKMYLGMLTVAPGMQDKGLGKSLLNKAESFAQQQNCEVITMTVITKRHELISWYERKGFYKTGDIKPFPNDPKFGLPKEPLEFYVMEKKV